VSIFPKECCYHKDPSCVYDCVGWDSNSKTYTLRNDAGDTVKAEVDDFTPVSMFDEELIKADGKGGFEVDKSVLQTGGSSLHAESPRASNMAKARKAERKKADPQDDAKEAVKVEVREILSQCETRAEIAEVCAHILGENAPDLITKYEQQDNGRFRMILGNRIRGVLLKQKIAGKKPDGYLAGFM